MGGSPPSLEARSAWSSASSARRDERREHGVDLFKRWLWSCISRRASRLRGEHRRATGRASVARPLGRLRVVPATFDEAWAVAADVEGWLTPAQGRALFDAAAQRARGPAPSSRSGATGASRRSCWPPALRPGVAPDGGRPVRRPSLGRGARVARGLQGEPRARRRRRPRRAHRGLSGTWPRPGRACRSGLAWIDGAHDRASVLVDIDGWDAAPRRRGHDAPARRVQRDRHDRGGPAAAVVVAPLSLRRAVSAPSSSSARSRGPSLQAALDAARLSRAARRSSPGWSRSSSPAAAGTTGSSAGSCASRTSRSSDGAGRDDAARPAHRAPRARRGHRGGGQHAGARRRARAARPPRRGRRVRAARRAVVGRPLDALAFPHAVARHVGAPTGATRRRRRRRVDRRPRVPRRGARATRAVGGVHTQPRARAAERRAAREGARRGELRLRRRYYAVPRRGCAVGGRPLAPRRGRGALLNDAEAAYRDDDLRPLGATGPPDRRAAPSAAAPSVDDGAPRRARPQPRVVEEGGDVALRVLDELLAVLGRGHGLVARARATPRRSAPSWRRDVRGARGRWAAPTTPRGARDRSSPRTGSCSSRRAPRGSRSRSSRRSPRASRSSASDVPGPATSSRAVPAACSCPTATSRAWPRRYGGSSTTSRGAPSSPSAVGREPPTTRRRRSSTALETSYREVLALKRRQRRATRARPPRTPPARPSGCGG